MCQANGRLRERFRQPRLTLGLAEWVDYCQKCQSSDEKIDSPGTMVIRTVAALEETPFLAQSCRAIQCAQGFRALQMERGDRALAIWRHVQGVLATLALSALLCLCPCASSAAPGGLRTVVVLLSENAPGSPGGTLFIQGLRATLMDGSREAIQLRTEPLDIARFSGAGRRELLAEFLQQKYAGQKVDLVIAPLASSLDFALEYREKLFPGAPIVFAALAEDEIRARTLPADVIGVPLVWDVVGTLEFGRRLQPETRRVFVVSGSSEFDRRIEALTRERFRPYESRLEITWLSGLAMDDLLHRVADLPPQSIVQYLHMYEDATGKTFIPAEALRLLAAKANAPIYSHVGSYIDYGIVGGHVMSFELAGRNAAALGLRILGGERPEAIPHQGVSSNEYVADWRQLRRWQLTEDALPAGTAVRYREPSAWERYRWQIVGAITLFILQTSLIIGLLLQRAHRRTAEEGLRVSQVERLGLIGRLLRAQEDESKRIARELHDDVGQGLALLAVEMDLLRQKLPESAGVPEMLRHLRQLSSSVHELAHHLHPAKLGQIGLVAAIRGLCRDLNHSHGVAIAFTERQIPSAMAPEVALCLYRIVQEALGNAIKHSGAKDLRVDLSASADTISLRVVDEGSGFDPDLIHRRGGLGLVSMRERVYSLGGDIMIDSQPGGGTQVVAHVPLAVPTPVSQP